MPEKHFTIRIFLYKTKIEHSWVQQANKKLNSNLIYIPQAHYQASQNGGIIKTKNRLVGKKPGQRIAYVIITRDRCNVAQYIFYDITSIIDS
jgi:hypothetical protein